MASAEILAQLKDYAETFAIEQLTPYTWRLKHPRASIRPISKEINDGIWGTIKLTPLEVAVIDSPLVQRLRLVRQLGVVHWVYPDATHSRFEHTLGVLHQTQQLINAINLASATDPGHAPIDASKAALVRLCAILHDVGHGLFSHVSEHALARRVDLKLALQSFAQSSELPKIQLSELMAYYLIGAPAFIDMLATVLDQVPITFSFSGGGSTEQARRVSQLVQNAIIGRHIDEQVPLLHEIITGPFDADKLDYYQRDARRAGVPPILDISRLLQKIVTREVASRDMPTEILSALKETHETRSLFGLKWSGAPILDELHLARVLLYTKIYRHKKVLAIEAMIDAFFAALSSATDIQLLKLVSFCYEFCDDQFLVSKATDVFKATGVDNPSPGLKSFVDDVILRLRNRNLYVSSLALMPKYPGDPWGDDTNQSRGLDRLITDCRNEQTLPELRQGISLRLRSIADAIPDSIGGIDPDTLEYALVISAKPSPGSGTEIDRALVLQGDRFIRARDLDRINRPAWADAYDFGTPPAVLFTPRECAAAAFIATERHIRASHGVVLPATALELSKQDSTEVNELKRKLEKKGWYTGVPLDVRATPSRLARQDVDIRIGQIADKLEPIHEPINPDLPRRVEKIHDRIKSWLAQFRDDEAIDCAIVALEKMVVLGRQESYDTLTTFVSNYPQFNGATICLLGNLKDSSSVQTYWSRDLRTTFPRAETVDEAVKRNGKEPIVLLDDFTATGSQVLDILGNWFNEDDLKQGQLDEARLPFNEDSKNFLRSRPVAFVFLAGWDDGLGKIKTATTKLGIEATVYAHLTDKQLPFSFEGALDGLEEAAVERFRDKCRTIGESLLASNGKPTEKQRERALGYGNRAMLLASHLNVPSQTLTCFWMDGKYDGVEWHALMRRRSKT